MGHSPQSQRTRVGGQRSRWPLFVALLGAVMLVLLVIAALQRPQPAATPTATPAPTPAPTPQPTFNTVYAQLIRYQPRIEAYIAAFDALTFKELYNFGSGDTFIVDDQHQQIIILDGQRLRAIDLRSLEELWKVRVNTTYDPGVTLPELALSRDSTQLTLITTQLAQDSERVTLPAGGAALLQNVVDIYSPTNGRLLDTSMAYSPSDQPLTFWRQFDDQHIYSAYQNSIVHVEPAVGTSSTVFTASVPLQVAASASELFVVDSVLTPTLRVVDVQSAQVRTYPLDIQPTFGPLLGVAAMAVSADGQQVALSVREYDASLDQVFFARRNLGVACTLFMFDRRTETLQRLDDAPSSICPRTLDFNPSGDLLLTAGPTIYLYNSANNTRATQDVVTSARFLHSELGPTLQLPSSPPPTPTLPPINSDTPAAPSLITARAASAPLAWIWSINTTTGAAPVQSVSTDGELAVLAADVVDVLPRPGQPPLLLQRSNSQLALVDAAAQRSIPLPIPSSAYQPTNLELQTAQRQALLSPDGQQLAMITTLDPLANDGVSGARQLVVLDLATQTFQTVISLSAVNTELANSALIGWSTSGLYLVANKPFTDDSISLSLWRLDPNQPDAQLTQLWRADAGALIEFYAAQDMLLYEPVADQLLHSELHLLNLATGADQVIYRGPFVNQKEFHLAPDGRHVALIRPELFMPVDDLDQGTLLVLDTQTGDAQVLAHDLVSGWIDDNLFWSSDSARVLRWQHLPYSASAELVSFDRQTGAQQRLGQRPIAYGGVAPIVSDVFVTPDTSRAALVALITQSTSWYLQRIPLADDVEPLRISIDPFGETSGLSDAVYLIYVP